MLAYGEIPAMLIITGPGRSGTSVLAQFCRRMGYDPGGDWHAAVAAGLEDPAVVAINDRLIGELRRTGAAENTLSAYGDEMRAIARPVVKDPRFTFHPGMLRAWSSVRSDLTVLLTYRKPEDSVASRERKAAQLQHAGRQDPDALRRDFADTIECLLDLRLPYRLLLFPQFLSRYDDVHAALTDLGLAIDPEAGSRTWAKLVDRKLVHFGPAPESEPGRGLLSWLSRNQGK